MSRARPRVLVIGAGILGASIAYHLARAGARVTVLEQAAEPATEATGKSFAWINASFGNPRPYFDLRMLCIQEFHRLQRELGGALEINWGGSLLWEENWADLEAQAARHRNWGYPLREVDRENFRQLEPEVADPPERALLCEAEGSLDPVAATRALCAAAEGLGVAFHYGCTVEALREKGADTNRSRLDADVVVLAAGLAGVALAESFGIHLALEGSPGLLVHTRPVRPVLNRLVLSPNLHMKQDPDGRIVMGEDFGGSPLGDDGPEALTGKLMRALQARLPGVNDLAVDRVTVGWRPMPKDGLPIAGFAPGRPNLYLAAMHSGITLAPAIGRFAAEEILEGARIEALAPFRPERFPG